MIKLTHWNSSPVYRTDGKRADNPVHMCCVDKRQRKDVF